MMEIRWVCLFVVMAVLWAGGAGSQSASASSIQSPTKAIALQQDDGPLLPPETVPPATNNPPIGSQDGPLLPPETVPPPENNPPSGDQDGMLPGVMNPDDDSDGVQDANDSAPDDPNEGSLPPPGPTDSGSDSDNDGLPNVMDPDDNNNGVQDADDPVSLDPEGNKPVPVPEKEAPAPASTDPKQPVAQEAAAPVVRNKQPVVLALPSTGTGMASNSPTLATLLTGGALILASGGFLLRRRCA